jgi:chromate reductase, NAD(P)H dehydrogenase (quinone)
MKILGIAGSLRQGSYNLALLKAAAELKPENVEIEIFPLNSIPPYNQDKENPLPEIVAELKKKIREADAILFAAPEYNHSVPGVFKNALDWASRPYGDNAWDNKPAAAMGASTGFVGAARSLEHLRQISAFLNMHLLNKPEVLVGMAKEKFDASGKLTDEKTREFIKGLLTALVSWAEKINS